MVRMSSASRKSPHPHRFVFGCGDREAGCLRHVGGRYAADVHSGVDDEKVTSYKAGVG